MTMTLGNKIKTLRQKLEIRQQDLCNEILSRSVLSKIENDKVVPSIYQLKYLANSFNVSIDYLLQSSNNLDVKATSFHLTENLDKYFMECQYLKIIQLYEMGKLCNYENINLYFYVGCSYYNTDFLNKSAKLLKKYLISFQKLDSTTKVSYVENISIALNTLCKIMLANKNYDKAMSYLSLAKKYLEAENKLYTRCYYLIMSNIGSVYCIMNNYSKTINILESFLKHHSDLIYLSLLPNIHLSLNIAYYNKDIYDKSIDHIEKAIFLFNYSGRFEDCKESYLNYINALRYSSRFDEAFIVINKYKQLYPNDSSLKTSILIQEAILYFNTKNYKTTAELLNKVKLTELSTFSKYSCYFMRGHISYTENNLAQASYYLKKCEAFYLKNIFNYDLKLIYKELLEITGDNSYREKLGKLILSNGKKNILIK